MSLLLVTMATLSNAAKGSYNLGLEEPIRAISYKGKPARICSSQHRNGKPKKSWE